MKKRNNMITITAAIAAMVAGTLSAAAEGMVCDVNGDGTVSMADAVTLNLFIAEESQAIVINPDLDGDGLVTCGDSVYLLKYMKQQGIEPDETTTTPTETTTTTTSTTTTETTTSTTTTETTTTTSTTTTETTTSITTTESTTTTTTTTNNTISPEDLALMEEFAVAAGWTDWELVQSETPAEASIVLVSKEFLAQYGATQDMAAMYLSLAGMDDTNYLYNYGHETLSEVGEMYNANQELVWTYSETSDMWNQVVSEYGFNTITVSEDKAIIGVENTDWGYTGFCLVEVVDEWRPTKYSELEVSITLAEYESTIEHAYALGWTKFDFVSSEEPPADKILGYEVLIVPGDYWDNWYLGEDSGLAWLYVSTQNVEEINQELEWGLDQDTLQYLINFDFLLVRKQVDGVSFDDNAEVMNFGEYQVVSGDEAILQWPGWYVTPA